MKNIKHGDFTRLASDYSKYRPGYSSSVLKALIGLIDKNNNEIDCVDIGAGTGIWTRMLFHAGVKNVIGVEPNEKMLEFAILDSAGLDIDWRHGKAENTYLEDGSVDMVSMASSFHWTEVSTALLEFHRILRDGGRFVALWNPRVTDYSSTLIDIENFINKLKPDLVRVSSGNSEFTFKLSTVLNKSELFEDVVYIESQNIVNMTRDNYIGAWRSVNDLRVQLGERNFEKLLNFIELTLVDKEYIEVAYLTRAWSARKKS